ncbi:hypothetical protein CVT26_001342 [Gymnopilus dilepis]|uniref:Uncharacterized protein n=1 Tax=Gymnopilus dilepis TaxID=231916 RepID=A0A409YUP2_9AGAR|nr:hypothetical protein CVT26_001342 [Gymnopilus dilepis]
MLLSTPCTEKHPILPLDPALSTTPHIPLPTTANPLSPPLLPFASSFPL